MNPLKGEASFELDGETYVLRYDVNVICIVEDALDSDVHSIVAELYGRWRMSVLRPIFRAGLLGGRPGLTDDQAGLLIQQLSPKLARAKVLQAIELAFPKEADRTGARPPAAPEGPRTPRRKRDGTGSASSEPGKS